MSLIKKPSEIQMKHTVAAMIYGQPGSGKAQPLYSKILTPAGFVEMGSIKVGNTVTGADGKPQTVTGVFPQGIRPIYAVTTNDGMVTHCDRDHIWTVRNSTGNSRKAGWRDMTLAEMIDKGILCPASPSRIASGRKPAPRFEIPMMEAAEFPTADLPIDPYILGVLIGDGSLVSSVTVFSNPDGDSFIADKVASLLPDGYHLTKDTAPACPRYVIALDDRNDRGEGFINKIKDLRLDVKSGEKFIPENYLIGDVSQRLKLLRGLMDTDGTCAEGNRVSFSTTSPMLAEGIAELVRSLGGMAKITLYEIPDKTDCYDVRIKLNICPFSLPRKAANWKEQTIDRYIVSVEYVGEHEAQCIKVSNENELYVTDNYIVTHNTTLACSAPNPVLFDFDNGVSRVNGAHRVDTVSISKWEEALEALEEVKNLDYQTIVIDTAGKMLTFMEEYIKRVDPKKKNADGSLSLKGFGVRKQMFINFLKEVLISGKNIIFVAHEMEQKRGEETVIRPEVGGSSANDLIKELDLVGYIEMYGKRRTISFFPCEKYYAKNSCNLPGLINIPVLIDDDGKLVGTNDFMTRIIDLHVKNIEASAEETRRFEALRSDIEGNVSQIANAKDANSFVEWVKRIDHIYNSRAVALDLLSKKVKDLGLTYDKMAKTYSDAEPSKV